MRFLSDGGFIPTAVLLARQKKNKQYSDVYYKRGILYFELYKIMYHAYFMGDAWLHETLVLSRNFGHDSGYTPQTDDTSRYGGLFY